MLRPEMGPFLGTTGILSGSGTELATGGGGRAPPQGLERRGQPAGGAGVLCPPPCLLRSSGLVRGGGTARGHPFKSASGRLPSLRGAGRCADIKARVPSLIPRRKGRASRGARRIWAIGSPFHPAARRGPDGGSPRPCRTELPGKAG